MNHTKKAAYGDVYCKQILSVFIGRRMFQQGFSDVLKLKKKRLLSQKVQNKNLVKVPLLRMYVCPTPLVYILKLIYVISFLFFYVLLF